MRKRIQQLANGKFDYTGPGLSLSTSKIEIEALEGRDEAGDFVITSTNHVKMRGIIYSSNPRMECLTPQFEGEEVRIRYQFHSEGLIEGDIQKGEFYIVCNQGEYNLSFVVSVSRLYADSSIGKIKNLTDFTKLARESFEEAFRLFYSQNFRNIIKTEEAKEQMLHEAMKKNAPSRQKVEEYLVAIHRKKQVELEFEHNSASVYEVLEAKKETVLIKKSQWGYVNIHITSDADWLQFEKNEISTEDFLGSTYQFEYYIDADRLHAGMNYARIFFEIPGKKYTFFVNASTQPKKEKKNTIHNEIRDCRVKLMQIYTDYRLKKIVTGVWAKKSVELLDHLMILCPQMELYSLMKAQALIINRQKQEASWILEDYKRECIDKTRPVWGYYLYLCTLMEREESYVDRLTTEIEELFHKNSDSSLLFWILLFVKEEYYRNNARRLKAIEQWIMQGNDSPYLYLEAYYLIWQDPYLLVKLGKFEIRILNWARKQGALTKDIAFQIMNLVQNEKLFEQKIFRLLCSCYEVEPSDEMIAAICSYLIKGQQFKKEYHNWFELGIKHEIRITNLYEAFLMSMDEHKTGTVPKILQMYFQYNSTLSYKQMAVLFVNIIAGKEKQTDVYNKYRRTMEQFAMTQIEAGHMDDNLAVIYDEMLQLGILNEELAHRFSSLLFTHKLVCAVSNIARAVIIQKQLKKLQVVPVNGGVAYFKAYSKEYEILLYDMDDNCYAGEGTFLDTALMKPERYIGECLKFAPDALPYLLYYFSEKDSYQNFGVADDAYFPIVLQSESVSDEYKAKLSPEIIRYYEHREYDGSLEKYISQIAFDKLSAENRRYLTELLADSHLYAQAYKVIHRFGYDYIGSAAKVALCSYEITQCGFEEDDYLLGLAEVTFFSGKYNDVILIYLCKFYNGATKRMAEIWKAAGKFEIDTYDFEERIITQMLYSTEYIEYIEQIYESYCNGGGREMICMAYLSYFSDCYLVHDMLVPEHVFYQVEQLLMEKRELNDACKLGLLKNFAEKGKKSQQQTELADQLLLEYTCKNIYFAFYKKLDMSLVLKYHLYDKFFLEYHANAEHRVLVNYSVNGMEYKEEEMTEMYAGIFVKEFILFFGESVSFYIKEELENGQKRVTESDKINNNDIYGKQEQSRYALLNEMLMHMTLKEETELKKCMNRYYGMEQVTEQIFKLL